MTDFEIETVQKTYTQIQARGPVLAKYFYNRIGDIAADLEPLFTEDKANKGAAFKAILDKGVESLQNPDALIPDIKAMEAKINYYNFEEDCINSIGVAFIDTLSFAFDREFTPPVMNPWVKAYKQYAALFFQD